MTMTPQQKERLRALPALGLLLDAAAVAPWCAVHGRPRIKRTLGEAVAAARAAILAGDDAEWGTVEVLAEAERLLGRDDRTLRPVINATGVIVHTNLGRAPLAAAALAAAAEVSTGYSALEFDLATGGRGSRHDHAAQLLQALTGAEAAVVVNNCAAAVHVTLAALAAGEHVVVSRGELVEIGGGFRVPDVMRASGAILHEVGTTNRTHPRDYETAAAVKPALLMKVHRSNFEVVGFTAEVDVKTLGEIGARIGVPTLLDAGAGALVRLPACPQETPVPDLIAAGMDVVLFSGDKLLGGPQAGLIVGGAKHIDKIKKHPMMRAMRPDKLTLAALVETLRLWRDRPSEIPLFAMLEASLHSLRERASAIVAGLESAPGSACTIAAHRGRIGGGSTPTTDIESIALRLEPPAGLDAQALLTRLREQPVPVIGRVREDLVWLDLRTVFPAQDGALINALNDIWSIT